MDLKDEEIKRFLNKDEPKLTKDEHGRLYGKNRNWQLDMHKDDGTAGG